MKYSNRLNASQLREVNKKPPAERVRLLGYRTYIGGTDAETWYVIGKLQYHFLVAQGLRHDHKFLDVACGALRLGQYLIPFLDEGCYLGIEGERELVKAGREYELFFKLAGAKKAKFAFNYDFDISALGNFDFAIAQSLFTHLNPEDIAKCFSQLAPYANDGAKFFVSYFEGDSAGNPIEPSHAQMGWNYTVDTLAELARPSGWKVTRIGDWGHPRHQMMVVCEHAKTSDKGRAGPLARIFGALGERGRRPA